MNRPSILVVTSVFVVCAILTFADEPIPAPDDLRVRYHVDDEGDPPGELVFQCSGAPDQSVLKNGDYDFVWDALLEDELPAVDGYNFRIYRRYFCGGSIGYEGTVDAGQDPFEQFFRWSPSTPDQYCWRVRGFRTPVDKIRPVSVEPQYGEWSSCCCFNVVEECVVLTTPQIITIGGEACGRRIEDPSPDIEWTNVARERGYLLELRNSENQLVIRGITGKDETTASLGRLRPGEYTARIRAIGDNEENCTSDWAECSFRLAPPNQADFVWWPKTPKVGQKVRCSDESTGLPIWWKWDFGDGSTSGDRSPSYAFAEAGSYDVSMMVGYDTGTQTAIKTIPVAGAVSCGDGVCEGRETAWSCPADCALAAAESGRTGRAANRISIPIVVGAEPGVGGTLWKTAAALFNPGDEEVDVVIEYSPLASSQIFYAGPFRIKPKHGRYLDNIVVGLFGVTLNGSLWIDASGPVIFQARSYNETPTGDYGQGLTGIDPRLTVGRGEGKLYLIGLREDDRFRTNLFFQEVDGLPITVRVDVFDSTGQMLGRTDLDIPGHSAIRRPLRRLGASNVSAAYATAEVVSGDGRMTANGSVIDNVTGDPSTIDALHTGQVVTKLAQEEDHQLVAVVAHTTGLLESRWRSSVDIVNPTATTQTIRLEYDPEFDETGAVGGGSAERQITIQPGEQRTWEDLLVELFELPEGARTQGALHLYSTEGVIVHSRTFNEQQDDSTKGQTMPALKAADLIPAGETGQIVGLRHTDSTRTNLGLAEFEDQTTEVELAFFTTRLSFLHLGTLTETVQPKSHLQLTRVFEKLNLPDSELTDIAVFVTVKSGGAVYAYGSVVDNGTGDATTYLASRE